MSRASDLSTLDGWNRHIYDMEMAEPGFWERNPVRVITHLNSWPRRYQFGYEIAGYGTVIGHCRHHKKHKTPESAFICGQRFLAGKPPLWRDRLPWMREEHTHD